MRRGNKKQGKKRKLSQVKDEDDDVIEDVDAFQEEQEEELEEGEETIDKRKPPKDGFFSKGAAISLCYDGSNYRGLQFQSDKDSKYSTIEEQLFIALEKVHKEYEEEQRNKSKEEVDQILKHLAEQQERYRYKKVKDDNFEQNRLTLVHWNPNSKSKIPKAFCRSCRTDKFVSAVRNIVAMRFFCLQSYFESSEFLEKLNSKLPEDIRVAKIMRVQTFFVPKNFCRSRDYIYLLPLHMLKVTENQKFLLGSALKTDFLKQFESDSALIEELQRLFSKYQGHHSFHNFTSTGTEATGSTHRNMYSIQVLEKVSYENREFIPVKIHGQSFMIHQIRKMVGCVVSVIRGLVGEDTLERAMDTSVRIRIPKAPPYFLFLDRPDFTPYNQSSAHGRLNPIEYTEEEEKEIEKFKQERIITPLLKRDKEKGLFSAWLPTMYNSKYFKELK